MAGSWMQFELYSLEHDSFQQGGSSARGLIPVLNKIPPLLPVEDFNLI
jgi:hypothetical protein